jgi:predicted HicB family RNase H-like nuclease
MTQCGMETKRPRGKPKGEPHTVFQFRLREAQKARYEEAARRAGKALAAWIKAVCDRATKR